MNDCDRCKRGTFTAHLVRLWGGALAVLCPPCRNAWHQYLLDHPLFDAKLAAETHCEWLAVCAAAKDVPPEQTWELARAQLVAVERQVFALSLAWLAITPTTPRDGEEAP